MKKVISIEGMMCAHCSAHVTEALNALPGVSAVVDLAAKTATVTGNASDAELIRAVTEAGYKAVGVEVAE